MNFRRKRTAFIPQVSNLENRDVPAHIGLAPKVAMVHAANDNSSSVQPISVLAGNWDGVFNASAYGASTFPNLPTGMTSHLSTKLQGNRLISNITGGTMPNGWAYTITGNNLGQLSYSMTSPFDPSVTIKATGSRVGASAWVFNANLPIPGGTQQFRIAFIMVNKNTYIESTAVQDPQGVFQPLYSVTNTRASQSKPTPASDTTKVYDYPYGEVIPDTVSGTTMTENVFNTLGYNACPKNLWDTITEADIVAAYNAAYGANSTSATINGRRHWVMSTITPNGGVEATKQTLTVNGLEFGIQAQLQVEVGAPTIGSEPYVINTVQRDTTFVFKKGRSVYELTDPSGNVYVMQSYSQQVDPSLNLKKLPYIGASDQLPTGWKYRARMLTSDLSLVSSGATSIVNDHYRNTFQINPAAKKV